MIILDEQLSNRRTIDAIGAWYRGAVRSVTELRPDTIIKDDAIPGLLCKERQPTFVTINVNHFWRKVPISRRFCVACFNVSDALVSVIPSLLRPLLHHAGFRNKRQRGRSCLSH